MNILEVQDLCKTYGTGETEVHALNHVSFSVRKGEFIAIIGESGSGKSTLLNVIGGDVSLLTAVLTYHVSAGTADPRRNLIPSQVKTL